MYPSIYTCPVTKYKIEYIIDPVTCTAFLNTILCDYKNIKAFMSLLRISIDGLIANKINKIRQTVASSEWNMYLKGKTTWKIINTDKNNEIYDIECATDEFLSNYGVGIGIL